MPGSLVERDLVPRDHAMLDGGARRQRVEGAGVAPADERRARQPLHELLVRVKRDRDPLAVLAPAVFGVGLHGGGDVRRQRPRRRRPDDERLAVAVEQRAGGRRATGRPLLVDARLRELVLGERRAAARAPLGRAVALEQPAALVHRREEPPDVLDVRVAEGVVVVAPVHPHAEALRLAVMSPRRLDDALAALAGELGRGRTPRSRASS